VPDLIFDRGAAGKEPMIRLIGKGPADVVEKALKIASVIY
jgi:hydroxymethylpyrimidine/phosphomethylpyrimidine kinase